MASDVHCETIILARGVGELTYCKPGYLPNLHGGVGLAYVLSSCYGRNPPTGGTKTVSRIAPLRLDPFLILDRNL